jgi:hypothetical protein
LGDLEESWLSGDSESDKENIEALERKALKRLCGEMMDEVFDESSFPLNSELDGFKRKGKSQTNSCLLKTCRTRRAKFLKRGSK